MNNLSTLLLGVIVLFSISACHLSTDIKEPPKLASIDTIVSIPGLDYEFNSRGKLLTDTKLDKTYTPVSLMYFNQEVLDDPKLMVGLRRQLTLLKYEKRKKKTIAGPDDLNLGKLENTIENLIAQVETGTTITPGTLEAYQLKGDDSKGNVKFTGYFTPILKVSKVKDDVYKYPLYTKPKGWTGSLPTRKQIDGEKMLAGKGLELAYAKDLLDIYYMQVQGSGIVEYMDGTRQLFAHNGSNKQSYRSIGGYLARKGYLPASKASIRGIKNYFKRHPENLEEVLYSNDSYVFFAPAKSQPIGAGMVPLIEQYSIAVDPDYIPLGSCLLARVPVIEKDKVIRHEYNLLLAQDIGGAIKGPGHVDLYTGIGSRAQRKASALHHYGQLWLLTSTDNQQVADLL